MSVGPDGKKLFPRTVAGLPVGPPAMFSVMMTAIMLTIWWVANLPNILLAFAFFFPTLVLAVMMPAMAINVSKAYVVGVKVTLPRVRPLKFRSGKRIAAYREASGEWQDAYVKKANLDGTYHISYFSTKRQEERARTEAHEVKVESERKFRADAEDAAAAAAAASTREEKDRATRKAIQAKQVAKDEAAEAETAKVIE